MPYGKWNNDTSDKMNTNRNTTNQSATKTPLIKYTRALNMLQFPFLEADSHAETETFCHEKLPRPRLCTKRQANFHEKRSKRRLTACDFPQKATTSSY